MNCKRVRDLFSAFFEDSLDRRSSDMVAKHLAECDSCRATYERFKSAISLLEAMPEVDPPVNFRASVMVRVEEETRRTAPARVKWWSLDWQRVFTIRVPARALAVGIAVLVAFIVSIQLVSPLRTGIASLFWTQKPAEVPISVGDQDTARAPRPWTPENTDNSAVVLSIDSAQPGVYLLRLNTRSNAARFDVDVSGTKYSGYVSVNRPATIRIPAPAAGSVRIVHVVWSIRGWGRYHTIFLPNRLQHRAVTRTFEMSRATVADVLRRICLEYGVAIIAWGNMGKPVDYVQVYQSTPEEAFYECLSRVGLKADGIASSVYVVEPVR